MTLLGVVAPSAGRLVEVAALLASNALATAIRFVLLRSWIGTRALARETA
jgi:hypothetical protein